MEQFDGAAADQVVESLRLRPQVCLQQGGDDGNVVEDEKSVEEKEQEHDKPVVPAAASEARRVAQQRGRVRGNYQQQAH